MAGFIIRNDDRNKGAIQLPTSSIAVTVGDLLELVHGATTWTLCTTSSNAATRKAIATETITTSGTSVNGIILDGSELVEATVDNAASTNHNGDGMILGTATTGAMTINNTGTTVAGTTMAQVFAQYAPVSTVSTTQVLGWILVGNGVLQSAT
jgi:hypothetical protein